MSKFRTYDLFKESEFYWLGQIPNHWEMKRVKHLFSFNKDRNSGKDPVVLSLTMKGIKVRNIDSNEGQLAASYDNYINVKKNDIVFNPMDLISGWVDMVQHEGVISPAYQTIRPRNLSVELGYAKYYFQRLYTEKVLFYFGKGISFDYRWTLGDDELMNFPIPLPPRVEQTAIANFLDAKTAEIKSFIEQKEKVLELLNERKKAVINKAITRGLNPSVKLKDSGIAWLGEIPEHWEVKPNKYLFTERVQRSESGEGTLLMISQKYGLVERAKYHDKAEAAETTVGHKECYENDLVFNKLKAHLGVFFKSTFKGKGLISPDYAVYVGRNFIDVKFYEFLFRHPAYLSVFTTLATGIVDGLKRLYTGDLFSVKVPVPPLEEQLAILDYIKRVNKKIDSSILQTEKEIELIKEYQQCLISEAVTGKIDVREFLTEVV